ncbi:sodium-dependent transporter [Marinimicrobium sp. ABcell2]|uniref:sodium-dependent transporter n=1 Tax=Marinimicrobium sp. ABcell2 TaxID=3069751 RepID=UPI0027B23735|nr:sodium-dependent transporter [Marinimicrobium sp. ABcell2]MDQ2076360.1 sodium-dependent transporter [Marinimicrobium sp. ABcell2]
MKTIKQHAIWGHRGTFILAATGSAVGLGNIWKFPYIAGENGGGAFVLMYLVFILLIGVPVMMAEVTLGRHGRANPIDAVSKIARQSGASPMWNLIGWSGVIAGFLILSFYSVVAGWSLEYFGAAARGHFVGLDGETAGAAFNALLANPWRLFGWQSAFIAMTVLVVAFGVTRGLETAVRLLMPLLFVLLLVLLVYAVTAGDFAAGWRFMFGFDPAGLSWGAASLALGHAFFTLSLAMGAIMAYGSYMPGKASVGKMVFAVAALDTLVALIAGLAIFPIVFATPGLSPAEGPGLMFISLPVAFGSMQAGVFFGAAFFALVALAAWSSTISLLEPGVAYVAERFNIQRWTANVLIAGSAWLLGIGSVLSFNVWQDMSLLLGMNVFNFLDFFTQRVMLPLGGLLMALFVGWVVRRELLHHEVRPASETLFSAWLWLLKYLCPAALLVILLAGLWDQFS